MKETYLGDGAYAEFSGYDITVYASNGISRTDQVCLGATEFRALVRFAKSVGMWQE